MVSMTMSLGTYATEIHPVDAEEIACHSADLAAQNIDNDSDMQDDRDNRPDHDHSAHHCGSCHVHIVGSKLSGLALTAPASLSLRPGRDQAAPRDGPLGLYRPPRA